MEMETIMDKGITIETKICVCQILDRRMNERIDPEMKDTTAKTFLDEGVLNSDNSMG